LRFKPLRSIPILSQREERLAAQDEDDRAGERRSWQGESEDGALLWTLEETEDGDVQISFETTDERLAGHQITFNLLDPASRQVRYSQHLRLEPTRTAGKWEAWCSLGSHTEFQGPYELDFEIVPPEEQ
jgi:hypothetical protein